MDRRDICGKISQYFSDRPEISVVILFGSAAEGRMRPHSDVDVAVGHSSSLPAEERLNMMEDLQILLGRNVDLVDLERVDGLIHYKILTKGIRLKGSSRILTGHMIKAMDFRTDFLPQLMEMQKKRIEKTAYGS